MHVVLYVGGQETLSYIKHTTYKMNGLKLSAWALCHTSTLNPGSSGQWASMSRQLDDGLFYSRSQYVFSRLFFSTVAAWAGGNRNHPSTSKGPSVWTPPKSNATIETCKKKGGSSQKWKSIEQSNHSLNLDTAALAHWIPCMTSQEGVP